MTPPTTQIGQPSAQVGLILDDIRQAFALQNMQDGITLMEKALALDVGWEALTMAVGEGIAGPSPTA